MSERRRVPPPGCPRVDTSHACSCSCTVAALSQRRRTSLRARAIFPRGRGVVRSLWDLGLFGGHGTVLYLLCVCMPPVRLFCRSGVWDSGVLFGGSDSLLSASRALVSSYQRSPPRGRRKDSTALTLNTHTGMESLRGQEQQQESTTGSFNEAQGLEPSSSTPSSSGRSFASRHSRPSRSFYSTGQSSSFRASAPPQPFPLPSLVAGPRASISLNYLPAVVTSSEFTDKSGSFDACHRPAC